MSVRTIIVAHDGSDTAANALAWAADLAHQAGARVVVVRAWSPLDDIGRGPGPADFAELHAAALAELRELCRTAVEGGVEIEARIVEDLPVPGIVRAAREVDADLIVCGTRGHSRVRELVLGSVARELPAKSHLPVTIVPPA
jgi:nucleotide-binding universal stress UspA family protein